MLAIGCASGGQAGQLARRHWDCTAWTRYHRGSVGKFRHPVVSRPFANPRSSLAGLLHPLTCRDFPVIKIFASASVASLLLLVGCAGEGEPPKATAADADAFVAEVNAYMLANNPEAASAQWLASTYINTDSQLVAAKAQERALGKLGEFIEAAKAFDGLELSPETARSLHLLKLQTSMPAPRDPEKLAELTRLATEMEGLYGAGKFCTDPNDPATCRDLGQLSTVLAESRDYDAQLQAWTGWRTVSPPMREKYQRFAELINEGATTLGFGNAGEMWRAGYDMSPADFQAETDRLWDQVRPLYEPLQCYVRGKLEERYGDKGSIDGKIPAHLTGNMWAQQWGNIWDLLEPYPGVGSLDVGARLKAMRDGERNQRLANISGSPTAAQLVEIERQADIAIAERMTRRAEDFYTSLGMPSLPETFYQRSQLVKPRDRDVVCHASAWDLNFKGDVRIKQCIEPTADEFTTVYHELGHIYYYLAYNDLPPLFQSGAHDGFHEAIGDTIVLAMTPQYLAEIDLVDQPSQSQEALINGQLRMALEKVAFLPFSVLIDRWRWGVFDGSITPENYNKAWWDLREKYQGVAAPVERSEELFDPGAKYHVPGNTPYTRYFLSHILQFQFYRALCEASGHDGPLHACSYYGNAQAGEKFWAMLGKGQSQPWPQTLKELTGKEEMDATAILDYFAPLKEWLDQQNAGRECGWAEAGA